MGSPLPSSPRSLYFFCLTIVDLQCCVVSGVQQGDTHTYMLPDISVIKNPPAKAGDMGLIPGSGRSPVEGSGNPPQYSCLENPMTRGAWWATVHVVAKELDMT